MSLLHSPVQQRFLFSDEVIDNNGGILLMKRLFCIAAALLLLVLAGCSNTDPGIRKDTSSASEELGSADSDRPIPDYIDADALAHRSYELRYLLAQTKFDTPEDISVSALVQFAFCHIYYEDLTAMPRTGSRLRETSADEIRLQLLKYFGSIPADITKADLYNAGRQRFEMWEPHYGTDIYYDTAVRRAGGDTYRVITTFYTGADKTERLGKTVLTVEDVAEQVVIRKMTSSR